MRALVPVAAALIALTGCGGDVNEDPGPGEPPSLSPTAEPTSPGADPSAETPPTTGAPESPRADARAARKALESWLDALAAGDGDRACALQTPRFTRGQLERSIERDRVEPGASCGAVVGMTARF